MPGNAKKCQGEQDGEIRVTTIPRIPKRKGGNIRGEEGRRGKKKGKNRRREARGERWRKKMKARKERRKIEENNRKIRVKEKM